MRTPKRHSSFRSCFRARARRCSLVFASSNVISVLILGGSFDTGSRASLATIFLILSYCKVNQLDMNAQLV